MLTTPCPYCKHPEMPEPPDNARPFGMCPACGKKSRAVISAINEGKNRQVRYVKTGKVSTGKTKPLAFRLTPENAIRLNKEANKSETVNRALELYYSAV